MSDFPPRVSLPAGYFSQQGERRVGRVSRVLPPLKKPVNDWTEGMPLDENEGEAFCETMTCAFYVLPRLAGR